MTRLPAANPCGSCPYRRDSPSGLWHESEYDKLREFDRPTYEQPGGVFVCHQTPERLCAGWVGCHDMDNALAIRLGSANGLTPEDVEAVRDYATDVPLFGSGEEAYQHGMREYENPSPEVKRVVQKIATKRKDLTY